MPYGQKQNIKQKQNCNILNKDFEKQSTLKMVSMNLRAGSNGDADTENGLVGTVGKAKGGAN